MEEDREEKDEQLETSLEQENSTSISTAPHWLKITQEHDAENLRDYEVAQELSNNGISIVSRGEDGQVYKRSIPFLIENELWCLQRLTEMLPVYRERFSPTAHRFDKYTILMNDMGVSELVSDVEKFMSYKRPLERFLRDAGIRHGDITTQAIIVRENKPWLIDFAEARLKDDPRPNKRPGTDGEWLDKTFMELCSPLLGDRGSKEE